MNEKHYLFYESKSIKKWWANATSFEKILCTLLAVFSLFLVLMGVVLGVYAEVENRAVVILMMIGIAFAIPMLVFGSARSLKDYYVILQEDTVCQSRAGVMFGRKKTFLYSEVQYVITGDVGPYIFPYRSCPEICRKHYGNYMNALSEDKQILFSLQYSPELESFLQQKCMNAGWYDIEDWNKQGAASKEIEAADKEIVETYNGLVQ